ncbi:hypothetical protein VPHD51_0188 [Vibrio phage D51]
MNDQQEKKLIIDDQMPPLENAGIISAENSTAHLLEGLIGSINQETKRTKENREERIKQQHINDILQLAEDCDFEITDNLAELNRLQLIQVLEALRNLHREQRKI